MKSLLFATLISLTFLGFSATRTSSGSGPWGLASTWGGAGVPNASDIVIIQAGHVVTHTANLTRNNNTTISGTLTSTRSITFGGWKKFLALPVNGTINAMSVTLNHSHPNTNNPLFGTINTTNDFTITGSSRMVGSPTVCANRLIINGANRVVDFKTPGSIKTTLHVLVSGSVRLTTRTSIQAGGRIDILGAPRNIAMNGGPITAGAINIGESARLSSNADITVSGTITTYGSSRFEIDGGTVQANNVVATGSSRTTNNGTYTSTNNFAVTGSAVVQGGGKVGFNSFSHGFGLGLTCQGGGGIEDNPLSVFDLTTCGQVLPVSYTYFKYSCDENILEWQTAQEENNDYFEVEASNDLINFKTLGKTQGNGTTVLAQTYSYTIESEEYRYYRLKQVDYNNEFEYSKIVVNNCFTPNTSSTYIYPTMGNNSFYLSHDFTTEEEKVSVEIINITGQLITSKEYDVYNSNESIDLSSSSDGTYIAKIRTNTFNKSVKLIKK